MGDVEAVVDRFGEYQAQLTELVGNVVTLYRAAQGLPTFDPDDGTVRVLHVSDIHNNPQAFDLIELLVEQFDIDAVADTGDITDWGTEPETQLLDRIGDVGVPYVWVRGNHDSAATQRAVAAQPNAVVLDGDPRRGGRACGSGGWRTPATRRTRTSPPVGTSSGIKPKRSRRRSRRDWPPTNHRRSTSCWCTTPAWPASSAARSRWCSLATPTRPARTRSTGRPLLVEGSTGGAGLRSLRGEEPEPLTCTVLYFDPDDRSSRRLRPHHRARAR